MRTERERLGLRTAALGCVCAVYVATLLTLQPSVFWSPDEGAKFLQMRGQVASADPAHRIAYGAASADPSYTYYPDAFIYPRPLWPSGVLRHWPQAFPALSLPFYRFLGVWGVYAIPIVCGLVSVALTGILAGRLDPGAAAPAVLLVGLGTPLFFYSLVFLEHTLAVALGLGALLCGWCYARGPQRRLVWQALPAAVCLSGLFALRDETLIFCSALACTGVLVLTSGRMRAGLLAGLALLPLLTLALSRSGDAAIVESRVAELAGDMARAIVGLRDPALWNVLPRHILQVLVNNPEQYGIPLPPEWAMTGLAGLGLCGLSRIVLPPRRFSCWLIGAILVGVACAMGLCLGERYRAVHGLLLPMPCLVLAWLPVARPDDETGRAERFLTALLPLYIGAHVLATWLLRRPAGGPEWGLRYALLAYPLAAVLGAVAFARFVRTAVGLRRSAGVTLAAGLFALSCGYGLRGVIELQVTKRDLRAFERELLEADCPILTDQWWLAAALAPTFSRTEFYTLNAGADPLAWLEDIGARTSAFVFVSYNLPPDMVTTVEGTSARLTQCRMIQEMTFSRYATQGKP